MNQVRTFIQKQWSVHAPLTLFSLLLTGFTVFLIVGIFADSRTILGQPAWLKPAKFGLSFATYTVSITFLMASIRSAGRWIRIAANAVVWVTIGAFAVEMVGITLQAARGTTSHFNFATTFDATLYSIMGVTIVIMWVANFVLAGILLFHRYKNPAVAWSLRLGMLITLIGMGLGFLMTSPTAQQMASWNEGAPITVIGAHAVGVPDGGPGIPVLGWSTEGGDLRIPHFVGMHALQLIPLIGAWVARRRLSIRQKTAIVWTASMGYLGLIGIVTWQALRGQSIIAPDALTITAFGALISAIMLTVVGIIRFMAQEKTVSGQNRREMRTQGHHTLS